MAQACGACGETAGAREQLPGRVEGTLHVSVRRRSEGRICLELCKTCKLYHCPFCTPSIYKPKGDYASVWTHIEIHRMRALKHGEFNIYSCNLQCRGERHFHCPYCQKTIITRRHFEKHMDKCLQTQRLIAAAKGSKPVAPRDTPPQVAATVGQSAILLLNFTPPFPQFITKGQSSTHLKSTADQHPVKPKSKVQPPASPASPVRPESTAEQHHSLPSTLTKLQSTADQHPVSPDCPVEPSNTSDQCNVPLNLPAQATTPGGDPSTCTENAAHQKDQALKSVWRKIKCSMCNLYLHEKNLRKHKLRKHLISGKDITAKEHLRSQCIDSHNGVYAVARSYKATAIPVHVIKKRSGGIRKMMCGVDRCEILSDFRRRSGRSDNQCPHLRSVDFCFTQASQQDLKPAVLEELVSSNLIGKDMKAKCVNHRDQAVQNSVPLVTLVNLGGRNSLYLSVFEPKAAQRSKLGRLFVTYSVRGRLWHCDCSQGRLPCLHKCIAKWYLFQTNKELFSTNAKRDALLSTADLTEESTVETSTEASTGAVYPRGEEGIKQMAKYIYNQKKIPSVLPESSIQFESHIDFSKQLAPAETVCHECPGQVTLTEPVLITNKARVITLTGVMEGFSTFVKKCPDCEVIYHYQEWSDGLHNYNSHVILSLQLCMLLRKTIKNHTGDSVVAEMLEQTLAIKSPCDMEVLQAYLHFEALTSHDSPSLFIMDLYRKGIFGMAGIEIQGLPESFTGEMNAEEVRDSMCMEIITSSLIARNSSNAAADSNLREAAISAVTTSFMLPERKWLSKQRTEECHRAVTQYLVKGLHPLSTVESSWFREMAKTLNPKYRLPSREQLMNTLIPSWYAVEKKNAIIELLQVSEAAVTCDWWTNFAGDHFMTVVLHFITKDQMNQKVLCTKQVYDDQTYTVLAEQIGCVLEEFCVTDKVVAVTVGDACGMDVAIKNLQFRKLRCFACVLNLAAQKVYTCSTVARWVSKIRALVVWVKRSFTAQKVLQEKQQLLELQQQSLVLDVPTRWNSLYIMVERFVEQYTAIQATIMDPQIKQSLLKKRLETLTEDDHRKAEEFIRIVKPLYTSSLCVSAEKSPTCSQIFPILRKLEANFETQDEDTLFTTLLKEKIWGDLSTYYKDGDTWTFLQESSAMDPRFKNRIDSEEIWQRVKNAAVMFTTTREEEDGQNDAEYSDETPLAKRQKLSALEELFEAEDRALKSSAAAGKTPSVSERIEREIEVYRKMAAVPTSEDALAWWWERRDTLPLLSKLSSSYLCIQASSTPQERVFSTAGDAVSQERLHVLPDQADTQIFLQKNC